jgi:hypothetical protein
VVDSRAGRHAVVVDVPASRHSPFDIGVVALLVWGFWVPEKSGGEHYQVIKDRCRSEVGSAGEITYSLVDDCIERKIDSL